VFGLLAPIVLVIGSVLVSAWLVLAATARASLTRPRPPDALEGCGRTPAPHDPGPGRG
jgi:hypothetical protein